MYDLVSLGEMMLRLAPPKYQRLRRATTLELYPCGAQFNIAVNLAVLGKRTAFLTKLPDNELGYLAESLAASYGVDTSYILFERGSRMGLIFVELGVVPRRPIHIYDRSGSAASTIAATDFPWLDILGHSRLAHVDGIFPALSKGCYEATLAFVDAAKQAGCTVCFDVNYRESLLEPAQARLLYDQILPKVDILVTNRFVSETIFGHEGDDERVLRRYRDVYGCQITCLTYRTMRGALKGRWGSSALFRDQILHGRTFDFDIVDRYGTGDAFFAGFLYAYLERGEVQHSLDFGNALCAIAHTTDGDAAVFSPDEVEALLESEYPLVTKR